MVLLPLMYHRIHMQAKGRAMARIKITDQCWSVTYQHAQQRPEQFQSVCLQSRSL